MSYNNRPLSPGGKRIVNQGRLSDQTLTDPSYYSSRHNSLANTYASPRTSTAGVIPISTQTFINVPPPSNVPRVGSKTVDTYSGRPRRSSLLDSSRSSASATTLPSRGKPNVVQNDVVRPSSPSKSSRDKEFHVTPASSQEPRGSHKKLYSVDDGSARLVADVNIAAGDGRHHKRRDSSDRPGYRERERDRGKRTYHTSGGQSRSADKSIDDEDAYSYTDAAGMYRDTQPSWRDAQPSVKEYRPRRGSVDRGSGASRERPTSMYDTNYDPRKTSKEAGPPLSTRGWSKINADSLGRTRSVRDGPREISRSPNRGRGYGDGAHGDPRDPYYIPPRLNSSDRRATVHQDRYDEYDREPRRHERRNSVTRAERPDESVERRGFGIRPDFIETNDRYGPRASDDSIEQTRYRDSGYAEPHRRDTVPSVPYHDDRRREPERKDRELPSRLLNEERDKEYRRVDDRGYDRQQDRPRDRDYDRDYERDREREKERARQMDPPNDRERERHHQRRDTADRDRDYSNRKENSPRQSGESLNKSGLAQVAATGLAGAAATFGISGLLNKNKDKSDKDGKDRGDRDDRPDRYERDERSDRKEIEERSDRSERRYQNDPDTPREKGRGSDEPYHERDQERYREGDRGLGFAFEAPSEPSRKAPPVSNDRPQDRPVEYVGQKGEVTERDHEGKHIEMPQPAIDAEEDYRRRMEQVQRELGRIPDDGRNSDSDPDRERRRREREQRQRDRESRNGGPLPTTSDVGITEMPMPAALRTSFDREDDQYSATGTASSVGTELRRKPSILDQPMGTELKAQIIDNTQSDRRENRVRIVDPPTEEEERRPRGILKKPTQKFPEDPNAIREGVAPLKDATKKGIPPGARWTKIDRRLVNPEALEAVQERFEERQDYVIVLRVLTKEEIQKLADRTREIRDQRYEDERAERKAGKHRDRDRDRRDRDEYSDNSENEFKPKKPLMLEGPTTAEPSADADFIRDRDRDRDRRREYERDDGVYSSSGRRNEVPGRWEQ